MKVDLLTCLVLAATGLVAVAENRKFKFGGRIDYKLKRQDSTKTLLIKSEQLLRIEEHDFAMRPGFGALKQMEGNTVKSVMKLVD